MPDVLIGSSIEPLLMMGAPHIDSVALAVDAGFAGVIIDCEHGTPIDGSLRAVVLAARSSGGKCIVRLSNHAVAQASVLADIGVGGFVVSTPAGPEDLDRLRSSVVIAPGSARGLNPFVAAAPVPGASNKLSAASRDVECWAMGESRGFLEAMEARVRDGNAVAWTGIIVGPYDLALDLGCMPSPEDPELLSAVRRFAVLAESAGLRFGMFLRDIDSLSNWLSAGVTPQVAVMGYDRDIWFQVCSSRVEAVRAAGPAVAMNPPVTVEAAAGSP